MLLSDRQTPLLSASASALDNAPSLPGRLSVGSTFSRGGFGDNWSEVVGDPRVRESSFGTEGYEVNFSTVDADVQRIAYNNPVMGWERPWVVRGRFRFNSFASGRVSQTHKVLADWRPASGQTGLTDVGVSLRMGLTDVNGDLAPVDISGEATDRTVTRGQMEFERNTPYLYELKHRGAEVYTAKVWQAGDRKPVFPQAVSRGSVVDRDILDTRERTLGINVSTGQGGGINVSHDFMLARNGIMAVAPVV